jgi:type IV pilus assembly protein PilW
MHARSGLRCSQQGYSLVELSVAVVIALFLLGGLFTLWQNTRRTYATQNQLAQLQDGQRLAMTMIGDVIQEAGYFPDPLLNNAAGEFGVSPPFVNIGQSVFGTAPGGAQGDTITVRYVTAGGDGVMKCTGQTDTTGQTYVNTFSVDAANELQCQVNNVNSGQPVTLVAKVQSMQIWYGVQTNTAVAGNTVDSYLRANEMAPNDWNNVISVRVQLNFVNPLSGQPGQPATIPFIRVVAVMNKAGVQT